MSKKIELTAGQEAEFKRIFLHTTNKELALKFNCSTIVIKRWSKEYKLSKLGRKVDTKTFVKRARELHGDKYDYSQVLKLTGGIPKGSKVTITCNIHGNFNQKMYNHLHGAGCKKCKFDAIGVARRGTKENFAIKAKKIHGGKYDYSRVTYINNCHKVEIICPKHGPFFQTPGNHLTGFSCKKCAIEALVKRQSKTTEYFIEKAKKIHGDRYDYSQANYVAAKKCVKIVCKTHGIFLQTPDKHTQGENCPKCIGRVSKVEIEFLNYIGIPNNKNCRQAHLMKRLHVDGYDPVTNTVYEFLGDYYHGNPDVFRKNKINKKCKKTFGKLYENTMSKFEELKQAGYTVKYIWEKDWTAYKKDTSIPPKIITY